MWCAVFMDSNSCGGVVVGATRGEACDKAGLVAVNFLTMVADDKKEMVAKGIAAQLMGEGCWREPEGVNGHYCWMHEGDEVQF